MKNFVQPGGILTLTAPYDRTSGQALLVGDTFGVATYTATSGSNVEVITEGVFDLTKVGSQAWSVGQLVYWDPANKVLTATGYGDARPVGVAVAAVGSGSGETTGRIKIGGMYRGRETMAFTAPYDVAAGDGFLVQGTFAVATAAALSTAAVTGYLTGTFDLKKVGSQAWAVGAVVYWDNSNKQCTTTSSGNTKIGIAVAAVGSGAGETTGRVRLNGTF